MKIQAFHILETLVHSFDNISIQVSAFQQDNINLQSCNHDTSFYQMSIIYHAAPDEPPTISIILANVVLRLC